jgi:hypothetical protein
MCGIILVRRYDGLSARRMVEKRYRKQKSRGVEGFGLAAISGGKVVDYYRCETESDILKRLHEQKGGEILMHHRKPTSTPNFWETAHPIYIEHESLKHDYMIVHNGVIHNADELRKEHDKLKFEYKTDVVQQWITKGKKEREILKKFNDSETFAIELARDLDGEQKGIDHVTGTIAFVALKLEKGDSGVVLQSFWGHNYGNPLTFEQSKYHFCVSSEGGKEIKEHLLFTYDYAKNDITFKEYRLGHLFTPTDDRASSYGEWKNGKWVRKTDAEREAEKKDKEDSHREVATTEIPKAPIGFTVPKEEVSLLPKTPAQVLFPARVDAFIEHHGLSGYDEMDPIVDLQRASPDMSQEDVLDIVLDLQAEMSNLEEQIEGGKMGTPFRMWATERLAFIDEYLAEGQKIMREKVASKKETVENENYVC